MEDLQPYSYLNQPVDPNVLAVGWLDREHPFATGHVSNEILQRVLALCFVPINQTRGIHRSPFIDGAPFGYPVEYKGQQRLLGSAEIRVPGRNGVFYASPDLIYHYMRDVQYLPPREFLEALEACQIE